MRVPSRSARRPGACAILTTAASDPVHSIHDRMPVLIAPDDLAAWLDPARHDAAALAPLLARSAEVALEATPVDRRVNDVRADDPSLLEPARELFSAGGAA